MTGASKLNVVLCEPLAELRSQIAAILEHAEGAPAIALVGEAGDGEQALELAGSLQPHAVVIELWLPRMSGLQAVPRIRERAPRARIVVYSTTSSANVEQLAASLGADAFVDKAGDPARLVEAVRAGPGPPAPR